MQATLKKEEGLKREFEVVIPATDIKARETKELEEVRKKAKFDGFRPGKAPLEVVQKKYGDSIKYDVLDKLIKETTENVFKQNNLVPCLEPKIAPNDFQEGKDFSYNISFEIFPQVPDFDFKKISITKLASDVTKDDVNEGLSRIASQRKNFEPNTSKTKAAKGDVVKFDFTGRKDGVEFPGGKSEGFMLELGSGQFIPGFEDEVVGLEVGKEKTFPITFPADYHSPDLAGQKTEFTVKLHGIFESKSPAIDEQFAKDLGFESLAKLEEAVEQQIRSDFDGVIFAKSKKALFDEIDCKVTFQVPEGMVALDYDSVIKQMKAESPDRSEKDLEGEARTLSERRVRLGILLSDIGRKSNIQVTNDEIRQAVLQKAMAFPGQEQRVIEYYQKAQGALDQVRGEILEDKVVKHLLEKVSVTEKKVSREELLKDEDAEHVHDENCNH